MHMKNFFSGLFYRFPKNIVKIFSRPYIFWHVLAIAVTIVLVVSEADWHYFLTTRNAVLQASIFPAIVLGGLLPIIVPLSIYIAGLIRRSEPTKLIGFALAQAAILGSLISSTYKAFTGRIPPPFLRAVGATDLTHGFQFGFWRGGIFWGWPSSHTTIAFAMAVTLMMLFPKQKIVRFLAPLYALYIGLGVSISIHWLSDFVAGAILGTIIGIVVGRAFRDRSTAS